MKQQQTINPPTPRPTCLVRFAMRQPGYGHIPAFDMFNIVGLSQITDELCVNSTVTLRTIRRAGFEPVEVA